MLIDEKEVELMSYSYRIGPSIALILLILVFIAIYAIPIIVANIRNHPNKLAITVLNIFLGWSVLGWIGALVWACTNPNRQIKS